MQHMAVVRDRLQYIIGMLLSTQPKKDAQNILRNGLRALVENADIALPSIVIMAITSI